MHRNVFCALALLCFSGSALALEIGFEGLLSVSASDNVAGANAGDELEGQVGYGQFGVFGEQKGTKLRGAFAGELYSRRQLDDPDDEFNAITQFLGAAEWDITPRAFSWYVGNILGGVRADDAIQPIDDLTNTRRNVFVTGPRFVYELDSFSRVNARVLYVNQTQNDAELESLINSSASWEFDTDLGNTYGLVFGNIYTDSPEESIDGDFNRFSLTGLWKRNRGRYTYEAQLGGTRYDTDIESLDGANVRLAFSRKLGLQTSFSIGLTRDLRDENLTTIETLFANGTGVSISGDGFFDETRLDLSYNFGSPSTTFAANVGASQSDFRLLADNAGLVVNSNIEDRKNVYASTSISHAFTARTSFTTTLSFENQDFVNRPDRNQSLLGSMQLTYKLGRSFEVQAGYRATVSEVINTEEPLELIDITENRLIFGLRWAPPTRASQDLTIELKSLLQ